MNDRPTTYADDPDLLHRVLLPYKRDCRYLLATETVAEAETASVRGEFAIDQSCYIDDTGHFNSVEFNICYNQLAYYLIAKSVKEGLVPEFRHWSMDDYWAHQLPDILIAGLAGTFRAPIDPRAFSGEVRFTKVLRRRTRADGADIVLARTTCRFWDSADGAAEGEVRLALVNPPKPPDSGTTTEAAP